ncbi:hypothetical protein D3C80_2024920 [compost metagenome]
MLLFDRNRQLPQQLFQRRFTVQFTLHLINLRFQIGKRQAAARLFLFKQLVRQRLQALLHLEIAAVGPLAAESRL